MNIAKNITTSFKRMGKVISDQKERLGFSSGNSGRANASLKMGLSAKNNNIGNNIFSGNKVNINFYSKTPDSKNQAFSNNKMQLRNFQDRQMVDGEFTSLNSRRS